MSWGQRLLFIVRVPGAVRQRARRIGLAVRGAQPTQCDRGARVVRPDERHLDALRIKDPQRQKNIGVGGVAGQAQPGRDRPRDLHGLSQRTSGKRQAFGAGVVGELGFGLGLGRVQAHAVGVQVVAGPLGAGQGPLVLTAPDKGLAWVADVELHPRGLIPAVVFALEEMAKETLLQGQAVIRIKVRKVGVAVDLEPFLLGPGTQVTLEVAPGVQADAAPVAC